MLTHARPPHPRGLPPPQDEPSLLRGVCEALSSLDPDVVLGWDVQRGSLGYLAERGAALALDPPLLRASGRTPGMGSIKERQVVGWLVGCWLLVVRPPPSTPAAHALPGRGAGCCVGACAREGGKGERFNLLV